MKKFFRLFAALFAAISLTLVVAGCDNSSAIPVTDVSLNNPTLSLTVGGSAGSLTATVAPDNATNKNVTWSSNPSGIVTITGTGSTVTVTPVAGGNTTITVTTADGSFTKNCAVTVAPAGGGAVTGISLNRSSISFEEGRTINITATVTPSTAVNKNVTWSLESTGTVTLSATTGSTVTVTAVAEGTTTITAAAEDGGFTKNCAVTVTKKQEPHPSGFDWTKDVVELPLAVKGGDRSFSADTLREAKENGDWYAYLHFTKPKDILTRWQLGAIGTGGTTKYPLFVPEGLYIGNETAYTQGPFTIDELLKQEEKSGTNKNQIVVCDLWNGIMVVKVRLVKNIFDEKDKELTVHDFSSDVNPKLKDYPPISPYIYTTEYREVPYKNSSYYPSLAGLKYDSQIIIPADRIELGIGHQGNETAYITGAELVKIKNAPEGSAMLLYLREQGLPPNDLEYLENSGFFGHNDVTVNPHLYAVELYAKINKSTKGPMVNNNRLPESRLCGPSITGRLWYQAIDVKEVILHMKDDPTLKVWIHHTCLDRVELWVPRGSGD
ncbi:MAG: Ig-like domain-containing protein [Treponema sp.]|nr:Ig-like domain-containing protein [Treponema sp.]